MWRSRRQRRASRKAVGRCSGSLERSMNICAKRMRTSRSGSERCRARWEQRRSCSSGMREHSCDMVPRKKTRSFRLSSRAERFSLRGGRAFEKLQIVDDHGVETVREPQKKIRASAGAGEQLAAGKKDGPPVESFVQKLEGGAGQVTFARAGSAAQEHGAGSLPQGGAKEAQGVAVAGR